MKSNQSLDCKQVPKKLYIIEEVNCLEQEMMIDTFKNMTNIYKLVNFFFSLTTVVEEHPFKTWEEQIGIAYKNRISLSASAFWKNSDVTWDPIARLGKRYNYYCYGTSASEVEVDLLTGHHEVC